MSFNPLAGIRCFLTDLRPLVTHTPPLAGFQSPSGDSLFSDEKQCMDIINTRQDVSIP